MAATSCAHISAYWVSVAAIAGVFCPKKFVATSAINKLRLAAISGGGTVAANAVSYAVAAILAWVAVCSACAAVALTHATYGAAAAAIDADDGPSHGPLANPDTTH